jgi:hypothetical protein
MPPRSTSQWSILITFADLMEAADAGFERLPVFWTNQINPQRSLYLAVAYIDRISGDNPGLAYPTTCLGFIPSPAALEANNQFIEVSHGIRTVRKASDADRLSRFAVVGFSIGTDLKHRLFPVNELAMNLAPERIHHGYLEVLIVAQAFVAEVLCKFCAMRNRIGICVELNPDFVSVRDAVFHIEEIHLHRNFLLKPQSSTHGGNLKGLPRFRALARTTTTERFNTTAARAADVPASISTVRCST